MGLPKRPDVLLRAPTAVFIGERAVAEILVDVEKPTKIDFIDVDIVGSHGWSTYNGQTSSGYRVKFPRLHSRVADARELTAGRHAFQVAFTLPKGSAPTHDLSPTASTLAMNVHVSIPWWPDGRYTFPLRSRLPPDPTALRTPLVTRVPYEAEGDEPRLELALASSTVVAGEVVQGSVAMFHVDDRKDREVDVSFEPYLMLRGAGRPWGMWGTGYRTTLTIPAGGAGKAIPLRVRLPHTIPPSFAAETHEVQWFARLKTGSLFTTKLEATVPIKILDARAAETLPQITLVPRLADERVLTVFADYARAAVARDPDVSLVAEERDEYPGEVPSLVWTRPDFTIRVGYAYRGTDGTFLVARLVYPPLGLGLSIGPSTALRSLLEGDIEVGVAEWDRVHRVDARSAAQALPFLRPLVPTPRIGDLVRWTDVEIVYERSVTSVGAQDLAELASALEQYGRAIALARGTIRPPADLGIDEASWQAFAERLGGRLCLGDMSLEGKLDTTAVQLGLLFDEHGAPTVMRVRVGDPRTASERAREAKLSLVSPAAATETVALDARTRSLLATWPRDVVDLDLANGLATAALPASVGVDATRVRELIRLLQALLASLDESTGPYR